MFIDLQIARLASPHAHSKAGCNRMGWVACTSTGRSAESGYLHKGRRQATRATWSVFSIAVSVNDNDRSQILITMSEPQDTSWSK